MLTTGRRPPGVDAISNQAALCMACDTGTTVSAYLVPSLANLTFSTVGNRRGTRFSFAARVGVSVWFMSWLAPWGMWAQLTTGPARPTVRRGVLVHVSRTNAWNPFVPLHFRYKWRNEHKPAVLSQDACMHACLLECTEDLPAVRYTEPKIPPRPTTVIPWNLHGHCSYQLIKHLCMHRILLTWSPDRFSRTRKTWPSSCTIRE
jgi:hypothetical protein